MPLLWGGPKTRRSPWLWLGVALVCGASLLFLSGSTKILATVLCLTSVVASLFCFSAQRMRRHGIQKLGSLPCPVCEREIGFHEATLAFRDFSREASHLAKRSAGGFWQHSAPLSVKCECSAQLFFDYLGNQSLTLRREPKLTDYHSLSIADRATQLAVAGDRSFAEAMPWIELALADSRGWPGEKARNVVQQALGEGRLPEELRGRLWLLFQAWAKCHHRAALTTFRKMPALFVLFLRRLDTKATLAWFREPGTLAVGAPLNSAVAAALAFETNPADLPPAEHLRKALQQGFPSILCIALALPYGKLAAGDQV